VKRVEAIHLSRADQDLWQVRQCGDLFDLHIPRHDHMTKEQLRAYVDDVIYDGTDIAIVCHQRDAILFESLFGTVSWDNV
jgi:hypothetical protein